MSSPLVRKLEQRDRLSEEERAVLESLPSAHAAFEPGEDMVRQGDEPDHSMLLLDGWAARTKSLSEGRRSIMALHVSGDFVDLHSLLLKPMDHSVTAITRCRVALVPHARLRALTERHPHLTRILWLNTLVDAAIHREWLLVRGRHTAVGKLAHLICELWLRLQTVDAAEADGLNFPLTQPLLGDVLGLSTVHVNRTVQELRATGLVTWARQRVTIKDWDGLRAIAEFDPAYLNLTPRPR